MVERNKYLKSIKTDLTLLIEMVLHALSNESEFKLESQELFTIVGVFLYLLSPIDLIPDFFGPIGFTDDIAVLKLALKQVSNALERFKLNKEEMNYEKGKRKTRSQSE